VLAEPPNHVSPAAYVLGKAPDLSRKEPLMRYLIEHKRLLVLIFALAIAVAVALVLAYSGGGGGASGGGY
jgi:hypothetical protein